MYVVTMAKIRTIQSSYVSGEFDPTLYGRVEIDDYAKGADKLRNVYVRPQGGAFRREGLEYYATVNGGNEARIIPFQFNDEQTFIALDIIWYIIAFTVFGVVAAAIYFRYADSDRKRR